MQGKHLSDQARGQILIHQELAKKNKLKVGDSLTLSSFQMGETPAKEQTFEIVGIFSGKKQEKFTGMTSDLSENKSTSLYEDATKLPWSQSARSDPGHLWGSKILRKSMPS